MDDLERLDVDSGPDVDLSILDLDFSFVNSYNAMSVRFWIEQLCDLMIPLMDGLVRMTEREADLPIRKA